MKMMFDRTDLVDSLASINKLPYLVCSNVESDVKFIDGSILNLIVSQAERISELEREVAKLKRRNQDNDTPHICITCTHCDSLINPHAIPCSEEFYTVEDICPNWEPKW